MESHLCVETRVPVCTDGVHRCVGPGHFNYGGTHLSDHTARPSPGCGGDGGPCANGVCLRHVPRVWLALGPDQEEGVAADRQHTPTHARDWAYGDDGGHGGYPAGSLRRPARVCLPGHDEHGNPRQRGHLHPRPHGHRAELCWYDERHIRCWQHCWLPVAYVCVLLHQQVRDDQALATLWRQRQKDKQGWRSVLAWCFCSWERHRRWH